MPFERPWHASYSPGVPPEIEIRKITMAEALSNTARKYPNEVAYIYMGKKITYRDLEGLVNRFARALKALGVRRGDKVAMLLPNIPQVAIADHACYRLGAVTAMNNPLYTERELAYQLDDSDARVVVTLDLLLPRLVKIRNQTKIDTIITCHINDFLPFPVKQLFPFVKKDMYRKITTQTGVYQFMDLLKAHPEAPVQSEAAWDDLAALIYTGGTTGVSKGAMLTHENISAVIQIFRAWFPDLKDTGESLLGVYPVFHSAGYSVSQNFPFWSGWTCVLVPRPTPEAIVEQLRKFRPSFLPGVPTIYTGLLQNAEFRSMDLSFVKGYFGGAAPLPDDTVNELKTLHGAIINDVYGATENTAFATCTPWKGRVKSGTVGVPLPNTDIKIVDIETGETQMKTGQSGEVCIKGPQVMAGYYKKPDETAAALRDGWFYTGDIGVFDEDGYLAIVDRKKDLIIAGGFNIYPKEVDQVLFDHPKVLEACTIGVPDAYRGESVKAFIVLKAGENLTAGEVIAYCKDKLAAYKVPRDIEFLPELPKSAIGKILRRELKAKEMEKRASS
ncbi:MAG TPA: long-chain fatty acid--CoA ligase [Deltaproteobacteria bacterium]|jgi:long-chain acyl-CoA synthetase|nr:long-chain fatty acid--CoA ligase [Deltaproteobacteria bacterium]OQC28318.1 MAG: Long-chain-fatty-acid--CoA ligase [Deltaproteobacteria bacterium ADurb.Bin072]HRW80743.1 long-chain fatty acid--CoA ligase [Desulfomonilia bacterium]NMD40117.1 long-chain fatty acid--CoA ligase [Deltaproteobacteria bacterium]HNQ86109.1 long-chain fatty acid--CoA ligase [Deltaproteobacteria bacterium]